MKIDVTTLNVISVANSVSQTVSETETTYIREPKQLTAFMKFKNGAKFANSKRI